MAEDTKPENTLVNVVLPGDPTVSVADNQSPIYVELPDVED